MGKQMKFDSELNAKILTVTANDWSEQNSSYEFEAFEFSNGLILVSEEITNDSFFDDRDSIEVCWGYTVAGVKESGEAQWKASDLLASIQGSIREFGVEAVPAKHRELWSKVR